MNFQTLTKIETAKTYIDIAFKQAKKKASVIREEKYTSRIAKSRAIESAKMQAITSALTKLLSLIIKSYPSLDSLTDFYRAMIKSQMDYGELKKALAGVNWVINHLQTFTREYRKKMYGAQSISLMNKVRKEFMGRTASLLKQIGPQLDLLENGRRVMKTFPAIKENIFTVALYGFPNVGKSTLLAKLTPSKPKIREYPFTTKTLNVGYIGAPYRKVQLIDTPGTLNRENKMNAIEKQAYLALKYNANLVVVVIDVTGNKKQQLAILKKVEETKKKTVVYLSKTDLADAKPWEKLFKNRIKADELESFLLSEAKQY